MNRICLYCQRALGCPLLFGKDGRFDAERLFTEKSSRQCTKFVEISGSRERNVRERMYKSFGSSYLRTLHELPELVMEGLRQGEKDELMYENVPNFQDPTLLWEGMTSIEREDVLRHQTDETGGIIVEVDTEGVEHKLARPEYHLKAYLCDPNGPVKAEKSVAWLWHVNQIVDHILKVEAELGLIVKVKKPSVTPESPEQPAESETNMPGRTVRTVRTTGAAPAAAAPAAKPAAAPARAPAAKPAAAPAAAPAGVRRVQPKPAGPAPAAAPARAPVRAPAPAAAAPAAPAGGRVANPPARRVATPAGAPGRAAARPAGAPAAAPAQAPAEAAGGISQDQLQAAVFAVVNPMFEELINLMKASQQTTIDCATILGDIAGQTGGKFQIPKIDPEGNYVVREDGTQVMETPQLWTHPSKIFAHVEGTGFNPENLHTVDDEGGEVAEEAPAEEQAEEEQAEGEA